ncbi:ZP1 protein, partial [Pterocles burchelli]|nr:ZP1 protein [Pterocles burchelli]
MGRRFSILLLLLLAPGAAVSLLRYRYDCGDYGMQLLAYPPHGRTLRFTVLDEFGTRFEVANCSICLHWLNAGGDGAVVFSSGYEGCHVLLKEDRYVLRVQVEEMLRGGVLAASYEVNMSCPLPGGDYETLTHNTRGESSATRGDNSHLPQAGVLVPLSQPGRLHDVSQSLTLPGPQISPQAHSEQGRPVARTQPALGGRPQPQPSLLHPGLQPQPRPGTQTHTQPILGHSGVPNQPGLLHPGLQTPNQPGLLRPGFQTPNQPGLVHGGPQNQPGFLRPGFQTPNQPGLQHPGSQNQPGVLRPGLQTQNQPGLLVPNLQTQNQPGLVHPGVQNQPGFLRPGLQTPNQPGLQHPGSQNQPGLLRPGLQTPNQPGFLRPGVQTPNQLGPQLSGSQSQPGLLHPNLQTPNHHQGLQQPGSQNQPGHLRPGFQTQNQPGLGGVQSGLTPAGAQPQAGFVRPVAQPQSQPGFTRPSLQSQSQTGLLRPGLQSQAGLVPPGNSRPALGRPGLSSRPGLVRPGLQAQLQPGLVGPGLQPQPQPGVLRPGLQSQPSLLQPTALFYPSPGADESYSSYHPEGDHPLVKVLRDPIYVEVRLLQKTDPNLVLVLHQCWASPSTDATAQPQWPILVDGCPFTGDNYRTQLVPVGPASPQLPFPSHYQRFVLSTFAFVEPPSMAVLEGEVYISCSASVCHLAQPEPCRPSCQLGATSR